MTYELELTGLDGSNPLGFLAALGTLAELSADPSTIYRMSWVTASGVWRPRLHTEQPLEASAVASRLAELLRGCAVSISEIGALLYQACDRKEGRTHGCGRGSSVWVCGLPRR